MIKKTYYSVAYAAWGKDRKQEAWFNNKSEAYNFADHDYRDRPIMHCVNKPDTIKKYDQLVAITQTELNL